MSRPIAGIVVVTYNSAREIEACVEALLAQEGVETRVVLVDNASADDGAGRVRRRFPAVDVVVNPDNVGFARAVNQGIERLGAPVDLVVLANPDTVAAPGVLAACAAYLAAHPDVGVVGPRLVHPDGSLHPSCHGFMTPLNLLGEALSLDRAWPGSPFDTLHLRHFAHDREAPVDWIQGAFLAVRPEAIAKAGVLDPAFFMYAEEMDWMLRLRRHGYRTVFLPGPPVMHVGGASSRPLAGPMFVELQKSRVRYLEKHHGPLTVLAARSAIALGIVVHLVAWELAGPWLGARSPEVRDHVRLRRAMFRSAAA